MRTVCAVDGSSMRNPGTHMGVAEDGNFAGSLSGGCIENAVIAEAQQAIKDGKTRMVRFGAGSPYLDIRLPCGGGLDLHFQPLMSNGLVTASCAAIAQRRPFAIEIGEEGAAFCDAWQATVFDHSTGSGTFGHWPIPRLLIVGHGAGVEALAKLAGSMGCDVQTLTSDERIAAALGEQAIAVEHLRRTTDTQLLASDPWTAIVFLFHDHDWETELMKAALALPHFYIGSMGGRKAHAGRCSALTDIGVSQSAIDTLHAPIGLFHSSRDPQSLALSALGEIMVEYQRARFEV